MWWDRADAVTGRGVVPPVKIRKNESMPRPSSEGRPAGRDGTGTLRVSPLLRGPFEGCARALSRPFPAPAAATTTVARLGTLWIGSKRPRARHSAIFGWGRRDIGLGRDAGQGTPTCCSRTLGRACALRPSDLARGLFWVAECYLRCVWSRSGCVGSEGIATWLILPVVICLSQRLSHACVSINSFVL
jgi:hypothetical protein